MTTKEWLNRGWKLNEHINKLLESQYNAFNSACGTTSCVNEEKVQTSCTNSTEAKYARYMSIGEDINQCVSELYLIRVETLRIIKRVDNVLYRRILAMRFVYFKPWGYIAYKVNKPVSSVKQYYLEKAIEQLNTIYCMI